MFPHAQRDNFSLSMYIILAICISCVGSIIVCLGLSLYYDTQKASCQPIITTLAETYPVVWERARGVDYPVATPGSNPVALISANSIITVTATVTHPACQINATNSSTAVPETGHARKLFTSILDIPAGFCRWGYRLVSKILGSFSTKLKVLMNIEFNILPLRSDQEEVYVITHLQEYDYRLDIHPVRACISVLELVGWDRPAQFLRWYFQTRGRDALQLVVGA